MRVGIGDPFQVVPVDELRTNSEHQICRRSFCYGSETCLTGDFNGDRRSDLAAFTMGDSGDVWVALAGL